MNKAPQVTDRSSLAVAVRNLGKRFRLYNFPKDKLKEVLLLGRRTYSHEFWALKDVSFDVQQGETLGIVGRNGSGKSTLLQIICETLAPTTGTVDIYGRVSALLELGSGFDQDFTGKENVYMNASILGLSRREIDERYGDILAFADIGDFINQPVRWYSNGMYLRLAFAVAVSVEPQILVVDEALAVGDEMFQRKCFSRIRSLKARGCTILLVSHSASQVIELCDRAMLLDRGECLFMGSPKEVVASHHKLINAPREMQEELRSAIRASGTAAGQNARSNGDVPAAVATLDDIEEKAFLDPELTPQTTVRYISRGAVIANPRITTLDGEPVNTLVSGHDYSVGYEVIFQETVREVRFGMAVKTLSGFELGGAVDGISDSGDSVVNAGSAIQVRMTFSCMLLPGTYSINCDVLGSIDENDVYLDRCIDAVMFRVLPGENPSAAGIFDFRIRTNVAREEKG